MIKEILRKGKFNDDDDCRKVEPDDIVNIHLKKCPYIVQNENQTTNSQSCVRSAKGRNERQTYQV